ncbi:teneurin-3 isoform X1 [Labeo rohita]|uniref:Teneurin-3 isoform X1 n=1 Tax=Labeo rohita TaxID=84645 RepID=A0A498L7Z2_LABRO|nr:teneurin-3 isoform X1 [Labeo rohita]
MDVKERRPYCSLTKSRREKERRYTGSSGDSEDCRVPTQKSYSSSETLKAFDHDSSRLLYGGHVKEMVHREADEYSRQGFIEIYSNKGQNFNLRQLGICEPATRRGLAFCAEMGLPHRGYSVGAGSDVDTENEGVMSPERAMRLWGRGVKAGRNSCLSSRSNSALTLTDTEHENKSDSENVMVSYNSLVVPSEGSESRSGPRTSPRYPETGNPPCCHQPGILARSERMCYFLFPTPGAMPFRYSQKRRTMLALEGMSERDKGEMEKDGEMEKAKKLLAICANSLAREASYAGAAGGTSAVASVYGFFRAVQPVCPPELSNTTSIMDSDASALL